METKKIFIKPAEGVKLYNPVTRRFISEAGALVPDNQYWSRRIAEGGAVLAKREAPAAESKSRSKKKTEDK